MRRRPLPTVREEMPKKKWRNICDYDIVAYCFVALVAILIYSNSLDGEFVHDDIPAIVENGDVTGRNALYEVFRNDFWGTPMSDLASHKSFRPLTTLSFRLNHALSGLSPRWWHACNVALHAACCVLVARTGVVVARLRRPSALLAALLFAVHPVHTEAVSGVVGRADVLACLFFLSSLLVYHGSPGTHRVSSSTALAALSMLAKETGITAILFNIIYDLYKCCRTFAKSSPTAKCKWRYEATRRVCRLCTALCFLVGLRLALLQGSLPAFTPQDNPSAFHPSLSVRLMTFSYLTAFNWWLVLCPSSLSHDWQMGSIPLVTSALDPRNLATSAVLIALLALAYKCVLDLKLQRHTPAAVGLMLLVIPFLPASNLLVTVGFVVAERVLYIPSIGSVYLTVYGVQLLWQRRRSYRPFLTLGIILLAVAGMLKTHRRNEEWSSKETLLRADLVVLPQNAKLHYNFGNFLKDIGQQENAILHYKEAVRLWPSYASAHNNMATLMGASNLAEHHFLQALKYNKDHVNAHYNLGKLYKKTNQITKSVQMLSRCIALAPRFVPAHLALLPLSPPPARRRLILHLLSIEPDNWEHYLLYGKWWSDIGYKSPSLHYYVRGMQLAARGSHVAHATHGAHPTHGVHGTYSTHGTHGSRGEGELAALRALALLLRALGQRARIHQYVTRWQWLRSAREAGAGGAGGAGGGGGGGARRAALARRALHYYKLHTTRVKTTCIHYRQLEIPLDVLKDSDNDASQRSADKISDSDDYLTNVGITSKCQKTIATETKKNLSIPAQHKPLLIKSISNTNFPLNTKKDINNVDALTPFITENFVKIY